MNLRLISIVILAIAFIGGAIFYKKTLVPSPEKKVYIYAVRTPWTKEDIIAIRKSLKLYGIKADQIAENSEQVTTKPCVKIFFEQNKFDECFKQNDGSLKIAVRINSEEADAIGVFNEDRTESLLELVESVIKQPINCLLIFDKETNHTQIQELAKIKGINLKLCELKANFNIATKLREEEKDINAVILIADPITLLESELIFEHFNAHKIPVFANHAGLIRAGALGGFDFDTQEIAYGIAEVSNSFFKDPNSVRSTIFEELCPQLHLNMDTIAKLGIQLDSNLLDEAVTVGSADL